MFSFELTVPRFFRIGFGKTHRRGFILINREKICTRRGILTHNYKRRKWARNPQTTAAYLPISVHTYLERCPRYLNEEKHGRIRFKYKSSVFFSLVKRRIIVLYRYCSISQSKHLKNCTRECVSKRNSLPLYPTIEIGND